MFNRLDTIPACDSQPPSQPSLRSLLRKLGWLGGWLSHAGIVSPHGARERLGEWERDRTGKKTYRK